tara:strand:+ start:290 stop:571 length:282 start_codon:yes stop_codon:yes gene_type:complete
MNYSIIEYLSNNNIEIYDYLLPTDVISLERVNTSFNRNIPHFYWLLIIKILYSAKEIIKYNKYFMIKVSDTHKIAIDNTINLKRLAYFLENSR